MLFALLTPHVANAQTVILVPTISTTTIALVDGNRISTQIHDYALRYNVDEVLAQNIIECESGGKATAININKSGSKDFSYWQINDHYWKAYLKKKGWDITKPEENLEAGFYLLSQYGSHLWLWSQPCWGKIPVGWEA